MLNSSVFIDDEDFTNGLGLMHSPTHSLPLSEAGNTRTRCYFLCYFSAVLWMSGGKKKARELFQYILQEMCSVVLGCTCSADACLCIPPLIFSVFIYLTDRKNVRFVALLFWGAGGWVGRWRKVDSDSAASSQSLALIISSAKRQRPYVGYFGLSSARQKLEARCTSCLMSVREKHRMWSSA